jgi:hypothetical protein
VLFRSLRNGSHLQAARAELAKCATQACPALVANDCTRWLADVEQQQPSIVVAASEGGGRAIVDASVSIDDKIVATKLDGMAIDVDPGEHELRVRMPDGRSSMDRLVVRESEKARLVRVELPARPRSKEPPVTGGATAPSHRRIPAASWVLGGVAVAAAIPWAVFGVLGWEHKANLDSTCKGMCSRASIADVHRDFNVADVAAAVALTSAAAAVVFGLLAPSQSSAVSGAVLPGGSAGLFTRRF